MQSTWQRDSPVLWRSGLLLTFAALCFYLLLAFQHDLSLAILGVLCAFSAWLLLSRSRYARYPLYLTTFLLAGDLVVGTLNYIEHPEALQRPPLTQAISWLIPLLPLILLINCSLYARKLPLERNSLKQEAPTKTQAADDRMNSAAQSNRYTVAARIAGAMLFAFGLSMALLTMFVIWRQVEMRAGIVAKNVALIAFLAALAAFCSKIGYRLAFVRPNRYGSLLSPTGWTLLGIGFIALAVRLFSTANVYGAGTQVFSLVAPGSLALACFLAARRAFRGPTQSPVFPADTSLVGREGFVPDGFRVGVEILNDNKTPMEFVIFALERHLHMNRVEAVRAMLRIHKEGGYLLPLPSMEEATRTAEAIISEAREGGHPLICRAVSIASSKPS